MSAGGSVSTRKRMTVRLTNRFLGHMVLDEHNDVIGAEQPVSYDKARKIATEEGYIDRKRTIVQVFAVERFTVPAWHGERVASGH